jgi:Arc/MetJ family transcription regulator
MRKTTLEIDDRVLDEARRILGTRGIKDTVDAALRAVRVQEARAALVDQLASLEGLDLDDPAIMRGAWR